MAQPADQDLTITRGDTETLIVTITTDGSNAVDITGRTYRAQVRSQQDSTTIKASFTCTLSATPTDGIVTCVLSATSSAALSAGLYFWDLEETASGTVSTILAGNITVLADVTR